MTLIDRRQLGPLLQQLGVLKELGSLLARQFERESLFGQLIDPDTGRDQKRALIGAAPLPVPVPPAVAVEVPVVESVSSCSFAEESPSVPACWS